DRARPARTAAFPYTTLFRSEQPEALEEHRADQSGLVGEQLVDRGHRGTRPLGHPSRGEPGDTFVGQRRDRHLEQAVAKLGRALLDRKSTRLNSSHVKISYAV